MQHNFDAAKMTLGLILSSLASILGASTSAIAISEQLNKTHDFVYLSLPIWVFFIIIFILSLIGAIGSLFTDIYKAGGFKNLSLFHQLLYVVGGFLSGVIGAFILLPVATSNPNPPIEIMMITALVLSSSGMVLFNNFSELKKDAELQKSVRKLIISRIAWLADIFSGSKK